MQHSIETEHILPSKPFGSFLSFSWVGLYVMGFILLVWSVHAGLVSGFFSHNVAGMLFAGATLCLGLGTVLLLHARGGGKQGIVSLERPEVWFDGRMSACGCQGRSLTKVGARYRCEICGSIW